MKKLVIIATILVISITTQAWGKDDESIPQVIDELTPLLEQLRTSTRKCKVEAELGKTEALASKHCTIATSGEPYNFIHLITDFIKTTKLSSLDPANNVELLYMIRIKILIESTVAFGKELKDLEEILEAE